MFSGMIDGYFVWSGGWMKLLSHISVRKNGVILVFGVKINLEMGHSSYKAAITTLDLSLWSAVED